MVTQFKFQLHPQDPAWIQGTYGPMLTGASSQAFLGLALGIFPVHKMGVLMEKSFINENFPLPRLITSGYDDCLMIFDLV
jgi:hypothetical protein